MIFPIPKTAPDILIYIWKIIDLPSTSMTDLLYTLSFELYLFPIETAKNFIEKAITSNYLIKNKTGDLQLSENLSKKFEQWQIERKEMIQTHTIEAEKIGAQIKELSTKNGSGFKVLLDTFVDKATINRAVPISNSALSIDVFNPNKGIIKARIAGTKEDSYDIIIDINKKFIHHNCHDFKTRKSQERKFCKHIVKLFLVLKDTNEKDTEHFLNEIAENVNNWDFSD